GRQLQDDALQDANEMVVVPKIRGESYDLSGHSETITGTGADRIDAVTPIYLDHNATTPVLPEVLDAMLPFLREEYGNASSIHRFGQRARAAVEESREKVAA